MIKINISPKAISDIKKIKKYISDDLLNQEAAKKQIDDIYNKIKRLEDFPLMGSSFFEKVKIQNDYRFIVSGNYIIFYYFKVDTVYIVRILYSKSDYMKALFE